MSKPIYGTQSLQRTVEHMLYFLWRDGSRSPDLDENASAWLRSVCEVTRELEEDCLARIIHQARCDDEPHPTCPQCHPELIVKAVHQLLGGEGER